MAKPSIFSKDYERRMKRRRKSIILVAFFAIVVVAVLIYSSGAKNMDFSNLKSKMQAWVDSGKPEEKSTNVEEKNTGEQEKEVPIETPKEQEKLYVNINLSNGVAVKAQYEEKDGKKQFISVDQVQGYAFNISPSKGQLLILDNAQNMKVVNTEGAVKDVTKTVYTSQSGTNFTKEQTLQNDPSYTWHAGAKFIDDTKIVYVSELPYFKKGGKKYVWMYDLASGSEKTVWELIGSNITIGDIVPDKGINVTVDGAVWYLKADGTVVQ